MVLARRHARCNLHYVGIKEKSCDVAGLCFKKKKKKREDFFLKLLIQLVLLWINSLQNLISYGCALHQRHEEY